MGKYVGIIAPFAKDMLHCALVSLSHFEIMLANHFDILRHSRYAWTLIGEVLKLLEDQTLCEAFPTKMNPRNVAMWVDVGPRSHLLFRHQCQSLHATNHQWRHHLPSNGLQGLANTFEIELMTLAIVQKV